MTPSFCLISTNLTLPSALVYISQLSISADAIDINNSITDTLTDEVEPCVNMFTPLMIDRAFIELNCRLVIYR
jgi:hypothetical protein